MVGQPAHKISGNLFALRFPSNPFFGSNDRKYFFLLVLCIFYFTYWYKIVVMEDMSLANRRGRREGDEPG